MKAIALILACLPLFPAVSVAAQPAAWTIGERNGRSCLLTPEGKPFMVVGISHAVMALSEGGLRPLPASERGRREKKIANDLRTFGFNTVAVGLSNGGQPAWRGMETDFLEGMKGEFPFVAGTYLSIGPGWTTMSNSPFRRHKIWTHEGGISTPLIASWPAGIAARGEFRTTPGHVIDVVPTLLELTGAKPRPDAPPAPGKSLVPVFTKDAGAIHDSLWWYHERNKAIQMASWKAVEPRDRPWELYDLANDRGESADLAPAKPEILKKLVTEWDRLADAFTKVASADLSPTTKPKKQRRKGKVQDLPPPR